MAAGSSISATDLSSNEAVSAARARIRAEIYTLALPNIVSNLSTPLISLVDSFVAGHLDDSSTALPAMAVGVSCMLLIYNLFMFLRKGTTGLAAQARGAGDAVEVRSTAIRAIGIAVLCGVLVIIFRHSIVSGVILAYWIRVDRATVRNAARDYAFARVYGAPFALGNFAITGFLNGMAQSRAVLRQQILLNSLNAILCLLFAMRSSKFGGHLGLGLGIVGIGYAAAVANAVAFFVGLFAVARAVKGFEESIMGGTASDGYKPLAGGASPVSTEDCLASSTLEHDAAAVGQQQQQCRMHSRPSGGQGVGESWSWRLILYQAMHPMWLRKMMVLNATITVRSLCLLVAITGFTALTASLKNETLLAANLLLLQLHDLISTGTDGFANASETLVGESIGARNPAKLRLVVAETLKIGLLLALLYSTIYWLLGPLFFAAMTDDVAVVGAANSYLGWLVVGPLLAVWAFLYDGFFVGATLSRQMMWGMLGASAGYLLTLILFAGDVMTQWAVFKGAARWIFGRAGGDAAVKDEADMGHQAGPFHLFRRQNDELWFCFYAFMVYRSLFLWLMSGELVQKAAEGGGGGGGGGGAS